MPANLRLSDAASVKGAMEKSRDGTNRFVFVFREIRRTLFSFFQNCVENFLFSFLVKSKYLRNFGETYFDGNPSGKK